METPTTENQEVRLVKLEMQVQDMSDMLDFHNKILVRGNGKPSLVEEVHKVVDFTEEFKDNYKYWSRWIIAGIVANILGFTFAAVLWFVKILPVLENLNKVLGIEK